MGKGWGVTNARSERLSQRFLVSIFCCVWSNIPLRNLGQKLAGIILLSQLRQPQNRLTPT